MLMKSMLNESVAVDPSNRPPPMAGFLIHDVARLMRKRFEQHARDLGLTRSQWQVLAYLDKNEGIRQAGLADLLDIEPITLGRILDKLESCGMVERRPHPTDRRVWQLYLTAKAGPKLATMRELGDRTRREAFAGVPAAEQEQFVRLLGTLKANLTQACD